MSDKSQSHHQSEGKGTAEEAPMPQSYRRKMGENVSGQDNPFGADTASTENKIANGGGKRW